MRAVWWIFDANRRQRWSAWLALAVLVALVGAAVLAGASAARATQRAFPDFQHQYGADVGIFEAGAPWSDLVHLKGVSSYAVLGLLANGNAEAGSTFVPEQYFSALTMPIAGHEPAFRILSGRLPRSFDEVMAGFSLEQDASLHLGSLIKVPFATKAQQGIYDSSDSSFKPAGPTMTFHVVGFYASILDFPSSSPSYSMVNSNAFWRAEDPKLASGAIVLVRLHGGQSAVPRFIFEAQGASKTAVIYPVPISLVANVVNGSLHPLVVGWWLFALIACLVGLALVAQALARQSIIERLAYPNLSAVGVSPAQLFWLGMIRAAAVATIGAAGAVVIAVAVSPYELFGESRAAEPGGGINVDPIVFGIGGIAIVVAVLLLAIAPCWRASRARSVFATQDSVQRRPNLIAALVARTGAPAPLLVGVRHALERGRGRSSVPVATALVGTVAAVVALVGSVVFGASLGTLLTTPRLWGQAWQLDIGGFSGNVDTSVATNLAKSPDVVRADYGVAHQEIQVNGVAVDMVAYVIAKGKPVFADIDGRDPTGPGEIALGSTTASQAHAALDSYVRVVMIGPNGKARASEMRVVGVIAVPPSLSGGSVGDGAVMLLSSAFDTLCGIGASTNPCRATLHQDLYGQNGNSAWGAAVQFRDTPAAKALLLADQRRYAGFVTVITEPTALTNFGGGLNFPLLLGLTVALFGAATLVHLMIVSVARRRREFALLKVLGFVRLQVRAAVCWQAFTISGIGILVGVPIGIAVGRVAWRAFASAQGVIDETVIPSSQLAVIGGAVLAAAIAFSFGPALLATRLRPANALRDE